MKKITKNCTGCGTCQEKCPNKAIFLDEKNIFKTAVIDEKKCSNCNICTRVCPSNKIKKENSIEIKVSRAKNSKNIIKSTSGGIFGEIARYTLENNGIVYGAVYTNDYKGVNHIRCDSLDNLEPLLKSKYLRSDLKNTYIEAEKDLKNKKTVVFSGTPCQIAGLKSFLNKEYENLYTIDIICHGTPSAKVWKKYAEYLEKKEKSKITYVDFRYLNEKDPSKNFFVKFKNGNIINEVLYDTSYGRAFFLGLINDDCCNECKFNDFKNYSDITIGDAWGYKNEKYPKKNSIILLNTSKGKKIYKEIEDKILEFSDYNVKDLVTNNYPIIHSTFNHYNAGKININTKNIEKELWHWLDNKNGLIKDENGVGILNFHYENYNYGANLVAYSLSKIIKTLGYNPYVIDFDPHDELDAITRYKTLNLYKFRQKYLNMTPKFKNSEELSLLNDYLDMYVVGSDQVWRKTITQKNLMTYFLDFVKNKNKISYAASFGKDSFEGDYLERISCTSLLSSFYNISVRENEAIAICEKEFNTKAQVVLDPTLLLTEEDYTEIIDEQYKEKIDVAVYFVMDYENKILEDKNFKRLFPKKKIVNIKGEVKSKPYGDIFVFNSISKWLDGFRKAEYIVTDSYHGLLFSLIFNKKVICIAKNSTSYSRFTTLFKNLKGNLEQTIYASLSDVKSLKNVLNYKEINQNIEQYRKKSIDFLQNNLGKEKIKAENEYYSLIDNQLKKIVKENKELEEKANYFFDEYHKVINSRSWKITKPIRTIKRRIRKDV